MAKYVTEDNLTRYNNYLKDWATLLRRNTAYSEGNVVHKGQVYLKCITAGTTDAATLSITSTASGTILTDGTVEWEVIKPPEETVIRDWESNRVYELNRIIIYNGAIYRCTSAHTSGANFDPTKWTMLLAAQDSPITDWTQSEVYEDGDIVFYGGSLYRCNNSHTSGTDFSPANWDLLTSDLHYWVGSTYYSSGTTVINGKDIYVCTTANTDSSFDASKWQRLGTAIIDEWEKKVDYMVGELVLVNGLIYSCNTDHLSGTTFHVDKDNWDLIYANVIEWEGGPHKEGQLAIHNRRLYRSLKNHTSAGFNNANWEEISPTILDDWRAYADMSLVTDAPLVYITFEDRNNPTANYAGDIEMKIGINQFRAGKVGKTAIRMRNLDVARMLTWGWSEYFGVVKTYHSDGYVASMNLSNFKMTFEAWMTMDESYNYGIDVGLYDILVDHTSNGYYKPQYYEYNVGNRFCTRLFDADLGRRTWHYVTLEIYYDSGAWHRNKYIDGIFKNSASLTETAIRTYYAHNKIISVDPSFVINILTGTSASQSVWVDDIRMYNYLKYNGSDFTVPDPIDLNIRPYAYIKNEAVIYNNKLYRCAVDEEKDTSWNPSHWEQIAFSDATFINDWDTNTDYAVRTVVIYNDKLYRCNTAHTSSSDFDTDSANWTLISGGGSGTSASIDEWQVSTSYNVGDIVIHNKSLFRCITAHTSDSSDFSVDEANWELLFADLKEWEASTYFVEGVVVIHDSKIYKCNTSHTSDTTDFDVDIANWDLLGGSSSGSGGYVDWQPNTAYGVGDKIVYGGQVYNVNTAFTSGTTFSDTNLDVYLPQGLTTQQIQNIKDAFDI